MENKTIITRTEFFCGIFAAVALRGHNGLFFNKDFEENVVRIFQELRKCANRKGIDIDFHMLLYPPNDYSETIHWGILVAIQIGIISLTGPRNDIIGIKLTKDEAKIILDNITEGKMFINFADRIVQVFSRNLLKTGR